VDFDITLLPYPIAPLQIGVLKIRPGLQIPASRRVDRDLSAV
jgi:hypothetical protein